VLQPVSKTNERKIERKIERKNERKGTKKQRRTSSSAKQRIVPWQSREFPAADQSRTTETIILSNSTRMPKGRQKKADTASRRHRAKKKEQRRGGTKEDKSLRGTTKLVRVIPVIKTKHQSKRTQDNVRSPRVATRQTIVYDKYVPATTTRQKTTTERRERRIKNRTKIITQLEKQQQQRE